MIVWRLTRYAKLDGGGGLAASARWHTRGHRIIYAATSPAGALIEVLVHLDIEPDELPDGYRLLGIELPDSIVTKDVGGLPANWRSNPAATRAKGDAWLAAGKHMLLRVPSAIIDHTRNVLINPELFGTNPPAIAHNQPFLFDNRLLPGNVRK